MDSNIVTEATTQAYKLEQCLFCPTISSGFIDSMLHMQKSHGLFIPYKKHLMVEIETLFEYLHLVIFGYRECIQCGTQRTSVQAVQQHMIGKGHCKFDISNKDSEFAEFYDFSETEGHTESEDEGHGEETNEQNSPIGSSTRPIMADENSIRLPSGRIISRQSTPLASSESKARRRNQPRTSRLEYSTNEVDEVESTSKRHPDAESPSSRSLSRREKRENKVVANQLASLNANDRSSLMHLPASQQRSLLAMQHKNAEKVQKEDQRRRTRIDRKGNKNLYAYWHTETPVYQCG